MKSNFHVGIRWAKSLRYFNLKVRFPSRRQEFSNADSDPKYLVAFSSVQNQFGSFQKHPSQDSFFSWNQGTLVEFLLLHTKNELSENFHPALFPSGVNWNRQVLGNDHHHHCFNSFEIPCEAIGDTAPSSPSPWLDLLTSCTYSKDLLTLWVKNWS